MYKPLKASFSRASGRIWVNEVAQEVAGRFGVKRSCKAVAIREPISFSECDCVFLCLSGKGANTCLELAIESFAFLASCELAPGIP